MKNNHGKQNAVEQYRRSRKIKTGRWEVSWLGLNPQNQDVVLTYINLERYKINYEQAAIADGKSRAEAEKIAQEKIKKRIEEFREMAERAMKLGDHPTIAKVHKLAFDPDLKQDFIVTDYVEGIPLDEAVKGMNADQIAFLHMNVLDALQRIHDAGFLHLNLKPDCIQVCNEKDGKFKAKLSRLGFLFPKGQNSYPLVGTPVIIAPELVVEQRADERSDLYSVGATMYQTLTGHFPHKRTSDGKNRLIRAVKSEAKAAPPSQSSRINGIESTFDPIVMRLLSKNPEERYKNAVQVKKALLEAFPNIAEGLIFAGVTKASELQSLPED